MLLSDHRNKATSCQSTTRQKKGNRRGRRLVNCGKTNDFALLKDLVGRRVVLLWMLLIRSSLLVAFFRSLKDVLLLCFTT